MLVNIIFVMMGFQFYFFEKNKKFEIRLLVMFSKRNYVYVGITGGHYGYFSRAIEYVVRMRDFRETE